MPSYVQVTPELATCHTFAAQESSKGKVFLCATSEDLVVIMEWSAKRGAFVLRNKFSTDQPCRAIEFTEQTVLVGIFVLNINFYFMTLVRSGGHDQVVRD